MIVKKIWALALLLALLLHVAILVSYIVKQQEIDGVVDKKVDGVEINLGLLGNLSEKKAEKKVEVAPKPKPKIKPKPKTKPKPKRKPQTASVAQKQKTEVLVQKQAVEQEAKEVESEAPADEEVALTETRNADNVGNTVQSEAYQETTGIGAQQASGEEVAAHVSYTGQIAVRLKKNKRYPRLSRRNHEEGLVKLTFQLDRSGRVLFFDVSKSSGYDRLDKEVLRMLKKAQPFPPFSDDMEQSTLKVTIPISFALR